MFVTAEALLIHRAVRMMRLVRPLLLGGMVRTRLAKIIVQLAADATFAGDKRVLEDFGVIVVLTRGLLLFLNNAHDEGLESLYDVVRLTCAHVIHAEKAMIVNAGKFLEFFAALVVDHVD